MKASDFAQSEADRIAAANALVQTETTDAVNSGLVGNANKSDSALKNGTDITKISAAVSHANSNAARAAVSGVAANVANSALQDTELEGLDDTYYRTKGTIQKARALKRRLFNHEEKTKLQASEVSGEVKNTHNHTTKSAYQETGRSAKTAQKAEGKSLQQLSEKKYIEKRSAQTAQDVQRKAQTNQYMHQSIQANATAMSAKGSTSAAAGSGGAATTGGGAAASGGGGAAAAGGIGCLVVLVILFLLVLILFIAVLSTNNQQNGSVIEIPEPYGTSFTVTGYDTYGWRFANAGNGRMTIRKKIAGGTRQLEVWEEWKAAGAVYTSHIATTNGRFLIACTSKFGSVGDKVNFYLSDGTVLYCIIADVKNSSDAGYNEYGHNNGKNVVEFEVDPDYYNSIGCHNPGTGGWEVSGYPGINDGTTRTVRCINISRSGNGGSIVDCALAFANDDSIGYSMSSRQHNPNMDCSSFVYYTLLATGYTTEQLGSYPFTTVTMNTILTRNGFTSFSYTGNESQLQPGDILLRSGHTEIYIGNGQTVGAHSDYDGRNGDSSGREVSVVSMSHNWQTVLRAG